MGYQVVKPEVTPTTVLVVLTKPVHWDASWRRSQMFSSWAERPTWEAGERAAPAEKALGPVRGGRLETNARIQVEVTVCCEANGVLRQAVVDRVAWLGPGLASKVARVVAAAGDTMV